MNNMQKLSNLQTLILVATNMAMECEAMLNILKFSNPNFVLTERP